MASVGVKSDIRRGEFRDGEFWGAPVARRSLARTPLALAAAVSGRSGRHMVRLRDLSISGAMVETTSDLPLGERVVLSCGTVEIRGFIVWVQNNRAGIEFHAPIDEPEVSRQLMRGLAAEAARQSER